MNAALPVIDVVSRRAALGVGFWDDVANALVSDGLSVSLRPRHATGKSVPAVPNPHGIHAFHPLPGSPEDGATSPAAPVVVDVGDDSGRFLPFCFDADLSASGLFVPACLRVSSPAPRYVPLFSSPTRAVPGGMAAVRAQFLDAATKKPAAAALVVAEMDGRQLARGVADDRGQLAMIFAYPEPSPASPPTPAPWRWTLRLRAFYSAIHPVARPPSLCDVLSQAPARILAATSPPSDLPDPELVFGQELVVGAGLAGSLLLEPI